MDQTGSDLPYVRRLGFVVAPREDLGDVVEIVPTVDGVPLTDIVHAFELAHGMETRATSYGGLIPSFFRFGPLDRHYLGIDDGRRQPGAKTPLLGCDCGEWGCWPFFAMITATPTTVTWDSFEQPHRPERDYSQLGPFVFARDEYDAALAELPEPVEP